MKIRTKKFFDISFWKYSLRDLPTLIKVDDSKCEENNLAELYEDKQ